MRNDLFDLRGHIALVTGAGSGLGRHFATVLASAGARVAIAGRRPHVLEEAARQLSSEGADVEVVGLDVTSESQIASALDQIAAKWGPVDVLINNAGVNFPKPALTTTASDWDAIVGTNLRGCFLLAQACARRLIDAGRPGVVLNVSSVLGLGVQRAVSAYAASKAGLLHLTRALALEWARHHIRVNALVPGFFRTDITGAYLDSTEGADLVARITMRRVGELDELTGPFLLLVSDASSYMTGSALVVDGGLLVQTL